MEAVHPSTAIEHLVELDASFDEGVDIALTFFLVAVIVGAVLKWVYSFLKKPLPLTIAVFIVGGVLALLADRYHLGLIGESIKMAEEVHPNLIFFILLPPLLFEAASLTDWPVFRKVFAQSLWLAGPGALIATGFMGTFVYIIFNFILPDANWSFADCLMFCSMFAATDTVAVVTTLDSLGVPNRVSAPIVGESLLNDGTAIVLFQIFKGLAVGESPSFGAITGKFIQLAFGGVSWGYFCALIVSTMLANISTDSNIEITLLFAGSYIAYFMADAVLHVSGVLAVIVFGLFMAAKGMYVVSPDVAKFEESFKQQIAFFCNTLIFFLAGIVSFHRVMYMPDITASYANWLTMAALFLILILARIVTVTALWPILQRTGYQMTVAEGKIVVWAGLRGAMTVALALAMDLDKNISKSTKDLMVFHLAGLTCLSLLINGTTIDKLYVFLDIHPPNPYRSLMFDKAMAELECSFMPEKVIELQNDPFFAGVDWASVQDLILDMSKAVIEGRARPEFQDNEPLDAYLIFTRMLDRRHVRKKGVHESGEVEESAGRSSVALSSGNTITWGHKHKGEGVGTATPSDPNMVELIVSPRGRHVDDSILSSTLSASPIDKLFGFDDKAHIIDIEQNPDPILTADEPHQESAGEVHRQNHDRPSPVMQLRILRQMTQSMKLRQRISRRLARVDEDDRNAQIVLTLFNALKADFREQFESHHLSHEAVWMLFDAANDGIESCSSKRPSLSQPFRAEWSSLSIKLERNVISPWLRQYQDIKVVRALGNWIMLENMFVSLEVLYAFIESHITVVEKVSKEVLTDPGAINKVLSSMVKKAEALLAGHRQAMPAFYAVIVTVLACRRLLHYKRQKLLSLSKEGVIDQKDMVGLIASIDKRLSNLSSITCMFRISQIRVLDRERSKLVGAAGVAFADRSKELIKKRLKKVMRTTQFRRVNSEERSHHGLLGADGDSELFGDQLEGHVMTQVANTVEAHHRTVRYDEKSFLEQADYGSDYSL